MINNRHEPTDMQQMLFCPKKYYLQQRLGVLPEYVSKALVEGRIGHDVMHMGFDRFEEVFDSTISWYTSTNFNEAKNPLVIDAKDLTKMRMDLYEACDTATRVMEIMNIKQMESEHQIEFVVPPLRRKGKSHPFIGTIDKLVTLPDTPPGYVEIVDWKFGRLQPAELRDRNIQHGLYYFAARQSGYKVHRNWWVHMKDFIKMKRDGKVAKKGELKGPGFYEIKITDDDIPNIIRETRRIVAMINMSWFIHNAYGPNAPCPFCEYSKTACKPLFSIGSRTPNTLEV